MKFLMLLMAQASANSSFMPPQTTEIGKQVDSLYGFLLWMSLISCGILIGGMIYFVVKYRRKSGGQKSAYISHNTFLEFLWSFIPLVIFLGVFVWGWWIYHQMKAAPENSLEVHVTGRQWAWSFDYKSGKSTTNEFVVPVNTPVKLILTSQDVVHSFYLPSMRIKQDAVPGMYTMLWFNSEKLGDFQVFCAEYCGAAHSAMLAKMKVVSQADYESWLQENDANLSMEELGRKLYNAKTCVACHSTGTNVQVGPGYKGIFGHNVELADGSTVMVDENYIRESILNPNAKVVKGFGAGVMPSFQGQLNEHELAALVEFIKAQK